MDIVSFSKAAKVEREVKQARDSYASLDSRLDAVSIGNVVSVKLKTELPSNGEIGRLYLVRQDSDNQNNSTTYTYSGGEYVKISGDRVSNHADNGALTINGSKTVVYTHPDTHSADILTDGNSKVAMTVRERDKLKAIEDEANKYVHPDNHSADMITDGVTHVSMTVSERVKLSVIDQWDAINDIVDYKDVIAYFAFDDNDRVIRQVVTDNHAEYIIREPLLTLPDTTDGYSQGDSFLVTSVGEVYYFDGTDFVFLPMLMDVVYQYDLKGRLEHKYVSSMGATPTQTSYRYFYDSLGKRIAVRKY